MPNINQGLGIVLLGVAFGIPEILQSFDIVLSAGIYLIFQLGIIAISLMLIFGDSS